MAAERQGTAQLISQEASDDEENVDAANSVLNAEDVKTSEVTDDMFLAEGAVREVGSMIFVFRLSDIDLVKQTFFVDFGIEFQYQCTKKEYESFLADPKNYVPDYTPDDLVFLNGDIQDKELQTKGGNQGYTIATVGDTGNFGETFKDGIRCPIMNLCYYSIRGTFSESFELENFPFDVQDLQITFKSSSDVSKVLFVPTQIQFKGDYTGYVLLTYSPLAEYSVHSPLLEYDLLTTFVTQSCINVRMKVERDYMSYIWKIYLTAFITTASTLFVWSMDPVDDLSDRLGFVVTLLLTAVAFQFVVSTDLPKLPYLTLLDEYILLSFVFLFLVMIMTGITPIFGDTNDYDPTDDSNSIVVADRICLAVAVIVLVLYHVIVLVRTCRKRRAEVLKVSLDKWKLEEWEKKYDDDDEPERIDFTISNSVRMNPSMWKYIDEKRYDDCRQSLMMKN